MPIELKDKINQIYLTSTDVDKLGKAYEQITASYLNNPTVKSYIKTNPDMQKEYGVYESLSMRLRTKELLLRYSIGYTDGDKKALLDFVKEALDISCDKNYMKTLKILANARDFVSEVHEVMSEAVAAINRVRDSSGELATDNHELIREASETIQKTLQKAKDIDVDKIFPEGVEIPSFTKKILRDLEEECQWFNTVLFANENENAKRLLEEATQPLSEVGTLTEAVYYENPVDRSKVSARAIVISTPFTDEAMLYGAVYGKNLGIDFYILHAEKLLECRTSGVSVDALFRCAKEKGISLIVTGIEKLDGDLTENVKTALLKAAHSGTSILIVDTVGGRTLYESFDKIASNDPDLSSTDIYHAFLTMPQFKSVTTLLSDRGYIPNDEDEFTKIKSSLPFMGFVGLNKILLSDPSSAWLDIAKEHSEANRENALIYLSRLIAPRHLIDEGWGNFQGHVRFEKGEKKHFDYDDLRGIDKENVRKIMEHPGISTFDRCGLIVKYCLLSGNDSNRWKEFDANEKSERASLATMLIARVLDAAYEPKVTVLGDDEWDGGKDAGGYCADGGKRIVYRESCVQNYAWMEDAVCHECYHAFQHTALARPYADWYYTELGVTQGRLAQWDDNFKVYVGTESKLTYRVEVVECDAKAFALDCLRGIENYWKDIDFD